MKRCSSSLIKKMKIVTDTIFTYQTGKNPKVWQHTLGKRHSCTLLVGAGNSTVLMQRNRATSNRTREALFLCPSHPASRNLSYRNTCTRTYMVIHCGTVGIRKRLKTTQMPRRGLHITEYYAAIKNEDENYVQICKDLQNKIDYLLHKEGRENKEWDIFFLLHKYIYIYLHTYVTCICVYIHVCMHLPKHTLKRQTKQI